MRSYALSDQGRVRGQNEDSYLLDEALKIFIVADGMGGHQGGHIASSMAVDVVHSYITEHVEEMHLGALINPLEQSPVPNLMSDAVRCACRRVYERGMEDSSLKGMGTTLTAVWVDSWRAFVAHVGDSRCYLARGADFVQLTDDHSVVNEQVRAGLMTHEEAESSRFKNIITRSVGFEADVVVDSFSLQIELGDRLLLCSDGLSNLVSEGELGMALSELAIKEVPMAMVELANERGGDDNITVVAVAFGLDEDDD